MLEIIYPKARSSRTSNYKIFACSARSTYTSRNNQKYKVQYTNTMENTQSPKNKKSNKSSRIPEFSKQTARNFVKAVNYESSDNSNFIFLSEQQDTQNFLNAGYESFFKDVLLNRVLKKAVASAKDGVAIVTPEMVMSVYVGCPKLFVTSEEAVRKRKERDSTNQEEEEEEESDQSSVETKKRKKESAIENGNNKKKSKESSKKKKEVSTSIKKANANEKGSQTLSFGFN